MIVVAPMLMATQCSSYTEPLCSYLVQVENKSNLVLDSLNVGFYWRQFTPDGDTLELNWERCKIYTTENQNRGYITHMQDSYNDKYGLQIIDTKGAIVADTVITLGLLPQDADDIKVILILEKTGELRIDKQTIKRAE